MRRYFDIRAVIPSIVFYCIVLPYFFFDKWMLQIFIIAKETSTIWLHIAFKEYIYM